LACCLLVACTPKPDTSTFGTGPIKAPAPVAAKAAITGALRGFGGDAPRFAPTDAAKFTVQLQDEAGQAIPKLKTVAPDTHGSFAIQDTPSGAFFAVATLPDKTTWTALVRTDHATENYLSPGTTLAAAWAKRELSRKLIFLEDLPYGDLLLAAARLDTALKGAALEDGDDARLAQLDALVAADPTLTESMGQIAALLTTREVRNQAEAPPYASDAEYDAKKQRLK
jgi:hypothetical protein